MKRIFKLFLLFLILIFVGGGAVLAKAETIDFPYMNDQQGKYIKDGVTNGNTHNYDYGSVAGVSFDSEGYVNYDNKAYVKKSVKENAEKQGLFDVTLEVKGNDINPPRDIDLVLVIDFSSTMSGEKLQNTQNAVQQFLTSIAEVLQEGHVRVGLVCYNRNLYSTQTFSTDANYLDDFLVNGAKSQSGTFTQKGLIEAERMFTEDGRGDAEHMLVHIGNGSANRSYIPAPDAVEYPNNGELIDYNGYHTSTYHEDFQTDSPLYHTTSAGSDTNGIVANKNVINDDTLGSVMKLKKSGVICYSVGVAPSGRGEYIAKNISSNPSGYYTIDENLEGLAEVFKNLQNNILKTIPNGTITDPMGEGILLQGSGNFTEQNYKLQGWRKDSSGVWQEAPDLVQDIKVTEANQTISVSSIALGSDERITLSYQVRIDTENSDFKGDSWYLCNGRTTLDPNKSVEELDFPIPSIKAPKISLDVEKVWENIDKIKHLIL